MHLETNAQSAPVGEKNPERELITLCNTIPGIMLLWFMYSKLNQKLTFSLVYLYRQPLQPPSPKMIVLLFLRNYWRPTFLTRNDSMVTALKNNILGTKIFNLIIFLKFYRCSFVRFFYVITYTFHYLSYFIVLP